jgi:hypothetical protein
MAAVVAGTAGNVMKNHHSVAGLEIADVRTHSGDDAGSLMAEDARRGVRTGGDLLQVCAANSAGMNAQQQFPCANFGHGDGFDADVIDSAINGREHGGGNRVRPLLSRLLALGLLLLYGELSGNGHHLSDEMRNVFASAVSGYFS